VNALEYLMGLKFGVVQLLDGVLHVLVAKELADAGPVFVNVRETNFAGVSHVVFLQEQKASMI
jgi:hypothetical protein